MITLQDRSYRPEGQGIGMHRLLEDTEPSTYGTMVTVAVAAKAAIAALETN